MISKDKKIAIAGAGIGGLAAGLALLRQGIDVDIYEQVTQLKEVGAGVQISPNGSRVLQALGLADEIAALGTLTTGKEIRVWNTATARKFMELGQASVERYGAPYLTFHRADLHELLFRAVLREKPDAVHLGSACAGFEQDAEGVELRLESGEKVVASALIGADGIHSRVRQQLFGADRPEFTGCMAWRGLIPASALPDSINRTGGVSWIGPTAHVLTYPVRKGNMLNFIGMVDRDDWQIESWNAQGTIDECLSDFEGWHADIRTMIRHIAIPYKWALIVRKPLTRWSVGRVSLLGDACHSTLPFLAQGANMAIEDAFILARCLAKDAADLPGGLQQYEGLRLDRTTRIVNSSAEQIHRVHTPALSNPASAEKHVGSEWEDQRVQDRYSWIYEYDATCAPLA